MDFINRDPWDSLAWLVGLDSITMKRGRGVLNGLPWKELLKRKKIRKNCILEPDL